MAEADDTVLMQGWVTKMGAVVKNWKMRWMILQADGTLLYVASPTHGGAEPLFDRPIVLQRHHPMR